MVNGTELIFVLLKGYILLSTMKTLIHVALTYIAGSRDCCSKEGVVLNFFESSSPVTDLFSW